MNRKNIISRCSVILTCFNGSVYLRKCLDSLLESEYGNYEVLLVDDGSTDDSWKIIKKYRNRIHCYRFYKNRGITQARNWAVKKSRGEYLLFLDIDTKVKKNAISEFIRFLDSHPQCGVCQGKLIGKDGHLETSGHYLSVFGLPYEVGEKEGRGSNSVRIFGARGAGIAVRKRLFELIGGFDEDFTVYCDDTDLCWRTWLAGYEVWYTDTPQIRHYSKSSLNDKTRYRLYYEGPKNNLKYLLKNASAGMLTWMLPLNILVWSVLAVKLIFSLKIKMALCIGKGIFWNLIHISKTLKERRLAHSFGKMPDSKIIFGSLSLGEIIKKGWEWLIRV